MKEEQKDSGVPETSKSYMDYFAETFVSSMLKETEAYRWSRLIPDVVALVLISATMIWMRSLKTVPVEVVIGYLFLITLYIVARIAMWVFGKRSDAKRRESKRGMALAELNSYLNMVELTHKQDVGMEQQVLVSAIVQATGSLQALITLTKSNDIAELIQAVLNAYVSSFQVTASALELTASTLHLFSALVAADINKNTSEEGDKAE